jgi:hypothetical protein
MMARTRFLDRHPRIYYGVMAPLLLLSPILLLIGGCREPVLSSDERMLFVPGEYELELDQPWDYALFHEYHTHDWTLLEDVWKSGELRYPDGVAVRIRGKRSGPVGLPDGLVVGWKPADGTEMVSAFELRFERPDTYLISLTRDGGPPRFATRIYLQRRLDLGTGRALAGLGALGVLASLIFAVWARKRYPRSEVVTEPVSSSVPPPAQEAVRAQQTLPAVLNADTLFREVKASSDEIVFTPAPPLLAGAVVMIVGVMFAGIGGLFLVMNLRQISEKHRAESIPLPPGVRAALPEIGFLDCAIPAVFVVVGLLSIVGALWMLWTKTSLIVNPVKRELVRRITLRWPVLTWTRSWSASDIDSVYLDEHVTVWPGTPDSLKFLGRLPGVRLVDPKETSEGHVWICLRNGKSVDCGKGDWEAASQLASRVAGLLGTPKTLRERFEVGPPPSTDTSA